MYKCTISVVLGEGEKSHNLTVTRFGVSVGLVLSATMVSMINAVSLIDLEDQVGHRHLHLIGSLWYEPATARDKDHLFWQHQADASLEMEAVSSPEHLVEPS